jgi:uncharacterized protein involved in response to NO
MPQRLAWLDAVSVISVALVAALQLVQAPDRLLGFVALVAALANGARLFLWRGAPTWRAPIVFVLHLGYAWLVVGLLLMSAGGFGSGLPSIPAEHAFGAGAVTTMVMAIMTRASLGHTGRDIIAPKSIVIAYGLLTTAALLRVFGAWLDPNDYAEALRVAGFAWIGAFTLFVIVYAPILMAPRIGAGVR